MQEKGRLDLNEGVLECSQEVKFYLKIINLISMLKSRKRLEREGISGKDDRRIHN